MERSVSGYKILMLLTKVDGKFHAKEDLVVRNWLIQEFDFSRSFDDELAEISALTPADYEKYYQQQIDIFYQNSNEQERNNLLQFAMNLIKADGVIKKGEHQYFDQLFSSWNEGE